VGGEGWGEGSGVGGKGEQLEHPRRHTLAAPFQLAHHVHLQQLPGPRGHQLAGPIDGAHENVWDVVIAALLALAHAHGVERGRAPDNGDMHDRTGLLHLGPPARGPQQWGKRRGGWAAGPGVCRQARTHPSLATGDLLGAPPPASPAGTPAAPPLVPVPGTPASPAILGDTVRSMGVAAVMPRRWE
jgi:hypothetical protein